MSIRRAQDERIEGNPDGLATVSEIMDFPDAPTAIVATNVGTSRAYNNGAATVAITPAVTGGTPATYNVISTPGSYTGSGTSPVTVSGLQSQTSYTFKATGVTSTGVIGIQSGDTNSITATTVPQAPTIGTVSATNGTTVSVPFTAGATGGSSITSYTVTSSPSISLSTSGTSSPLTVTGTFADGQAYTFTMTATNANGTSTASSASNSITPYVRPTYFVFADQSNTGSMRYSTNAISWSAASKPSSTQGSYGVGAGNGYYATVTNYVYNTNSGYVYYSSNLTTWSSSTLPKPSSGGYSTGAQQGPIGYGGGIWLTAGQGGTVYTSTDLVSWTLRSTDGTTEWISWAYGDGYHVLVGSNKVAYSTNGTTWTTGQPFGTDSQYAVGYGPNGFFSGGYQGNIYTGGPASWTQRVARVSGVDTIGGSGQPNGAAYGNGKYIFGTNAGNGFLKVSTNLTSWTTQALPMSPTRGVYNVMYSTKDNLWCIGGDSETVVWTSPDAVSWTSRTHAGGASPAMYGGTWG